MSKNEDQKPAEEIPKRLPWEKAENKGLPLRDPSPTLNTNPNTTPNNGSSNNNGTSGSNNSGKDKS